MISVEERSTTEAQIESLRLQMTNCFECESDPQTNEIILCKGCAALNKELRRLEAVVKE